MWNYFVFHYCTKGENVLFFSRVPRLPSLVFLVKVNAVYRQIGAITVTGKMEVLGEGLVPFPVGPPQISQGLTETKNGTLQQEEGD
jgi:hypothetical protein